MPVVFPYTSQKFLCFDGDQFLSKLSIAVILIDEFTKREPIGNVVVSILNNNQKSIRNLSGYYCFLDLPDGICNLVITSDLYHSVTRHVTLPPVDPKNPSVEVHLIPKVFYPLPSGSTSVRGMLSTPSNAGVANADIQCISAYPDSAIFAAIDQGGSSPGEQALILVNTAGQIAVGETLLIKDNDFLRWEFCKIQTLPPNPGALYQLARPLRFKHISGTALHRMKTEKDPATNTVIILKATSDEKGEFVIYVKETKAPRLLARITITHPNYQSFSRDTIELIEGNETSLGKIQLIPI